MKKIIRKLFNVVGYDIVKTNDWDKKSKNKKVLVRVGNFDILMPSNNPQISNYKNTPDLNIELAILAKAVAKKYPDLVLIDIGANVGDTIAVVKSFIDLPIIAIEGDVTSLKFLELNAVNFKNITIINTFLGESKQIVKADIEKQGWNNTIIPNFLAKTELYVNTLDNILEENNLNAINSKLLKIDTEGFDTIILRGCNKLLTEKKPVIYLEFNAQNMKAIGENGIDTILSLKQFGYNDIFIFDGLSNLILSTTLQNEILLLQLDKYLRKNNAINPFFDICIFHTNDDDLAKEFLNQEKHLTV
jgi:FkbM family methyltransferase